MNRWPFSLNRLGWQWLPEEGRLYIIHKETFFLVHIILQHIQYKHSSVTLYTEMISLSNGFADDANRQPERKLYFLFLTMHLNNENHIERLHVLTK